MTSLRFPLPLVEGGAESQRAPDDAQPAILPFPSGDPRHEGRFLLSQGNSKLGDSFLSFDLPAYETCPGRSRVCSGIIKLNRKAKGSRRCYALRLYQHRPGLLRAHRRNLEAIADLKAFVRRVVREIRFRCLPSVRLHVAGDFMTARYAKAWLAIMERLPSTEFLVYTRSWRVPRIAPVLARMARLPHVALWLSCDASTGTPSIVPEGARLCWMALYAAEGEEWACAESIQRCSLVFLDMGLRHLGLTTFAGVLTCPQERDSRVTCASCRRCLPEAS